MSSKRQVLRVGYYAIPAGHIANVITCLEMTAKPVIKRGKNEAGRTVKRIIDVDLQEYRNFYKEVGEDWLWDKHLAMGDDELRKTLHNPLFETYIAYRDTRKIGLLVLDFREKNECEILYYGIIKEEIGKGTGRYLMDFCFRTAWAHPIRRLWLHTCNFDHPDIVSIYQHFGFKPYAFMVEVVPDARITGQLSRSAAPQIPLLE